MKVPPFHGEPPMRWLAAHLKERYTPFCYTCDCMGTHPECARNRADPLIQTRLNQLSIIVKYLYRMEQDYLDTIKAEYDAQKK